MNGPALRHLDLNLLRVFLEVYDARGVSAAGQRLHLSQPAVSNALARLRAALGDELFVRAGQGLAPTAFAQRVVPRVRDALSGLADALQHEPPFDPARSSRWFRVALTDAGELVFAPVLVSALAERAPGVRLEIVPLAFAALAQVLADGTLDLAIGPLPLADAPDLRATALFRERYAGLVRRDGRLHRAAGASRRLPAAAMRTAPLVLVVQSGTLHASVAQAIAAEGLERNVVGRVPHFVAVPALVAGYDALSVVPSEIAAIFERRGMGVAVHLPLRLAPYDVSIARHRRYDRDPGLDWFCRLAVQVLGRAGRGRRP